MIQLTMFSTVFDIYKFNINICTIWKSQGPTKTRSSYNYRHLDTFIHPHHKINIHTPQPSQWPMHNTSNVLGASLSPYNTSTMHWGYTALNSIVPHYTRHCTSHNCLLTPITEDMSQIHLDPLYISHDASLRAYHSQSIYHNEICLYLCTSLPFNHWESPSNNTETLSVHIIRAYHGISSHSIT